MVFNGRVVELRPGQLITGRNSISAKTGIHPSKVRRVLQTLKIEQQIEQVPGAKSSMITLLQWASFQNIDQQHGQQANSNRPAAGHKQEGEEDQEGQRESAPAAPPLPPFVKPARRPASLAECLTAAQFIGMSEQDARDWHRDCEACEWMRGDGTPFDHWKRQMCIHRDNLKRGPGTQRPRVHRTAGIGKQPSAWELKTRLDAVEDEIRSVKGRGISHPTGWQAANDADRARLKELNQTAQSLRDALIPAPPRSVQPPPQPPVSSQPKAQPDPVAAGIDLAEVVAACRASVDAAETPGTRPRRRL